MKPEILEAFHELLAFLFWAEYADNPMYGARNATQALDAIRVIMGYDQETFDKLRDVFIK